MQELRVCLYDAGDGERVGAVVDDRVYDLNLCCEQQLSQERGSTDAESLARRMAPPDLAGFLSGGGTVIEASRRALKWALESGSGESATGEPLHRELKDARLRAPVLPTTKVICMGLVYKTHADVAGAAPHPEPRYFTKMSQVVVGPDEWVVLPKHYPEPVVYGTELTVVFGKKGRSIPEDRVYEHIWGYTVLNDMTMTGRPSPSHKVFDTSAPVGPWIVPRDQIDDPHNLRLSFRVNGEQVQDDTTSNMLFTIPQMVAEVSKWLTLNPGDIIATGDVGATTHLKPGDVMEAEVEGVGVLRNPVKLEE